MDCQKAYLVCEYENPKLFLEEFFKYDETTTCFCNIMFERLNFIIANSVPQIVMESNGSTGRHWPEEASSLPPWACRHAGTQKQASSALDNPAPYDQATD